MSGPAGSARRSIGTWQAVCAALIVLLVGYLALVAVRIAIDYFDAYEVLLNAKSIANGGRFAYSTLRAIFLPSVLAPYFALERLLEIDGLAWIAAHLTAIAAFALLIYAFHALLRFDLSPAWAAVGSLCLALNPLLIHVAPTAKEDIPGALLNTLVFLFYIRGSRRRSVRDWVWAGIFLGAAALTRYNLAPLLLAVIALYELASGETRFRRGERLPAKLLTLVVLPAVLVCLVPMIVYPLIGRASWWSAPAVFLRELRALTGMVNLYEFESATENFRFLAKSLTAPLVACGAFGLVVAWRRPHPTTASFHAIWLAVFLIVHTWFVRHKEARYLFPLLPPVYFFVTYGLATAVEALERRFARAWLAGAVVALVLAMPAVVALRACARFGDPVYTQGFGRQLSLFAAESAGDARLYWVGESYPVHPEDYWFDADDEYTSLYHFGAPGVELHSERRVELAQAMGWPSDPAAPLLLRRPGTFADGDVFVVNRERNEYTTSTLPAELRPVEVQRLRIIPMTPAGDAGAPLHFVGPSGETLDVTHGDGRATVEGRGIADGHHLLYADAGTRAKVLLGDTRVQDGRLEISVPAGLLGPKTRVDRILLYRLEPLARFTLPRRAAERSRSRGAHRRRRARTARSAA